MNQRKETMAKQIIITAAYLLLCFLQGILSLQWTGSVTDGQILHACAGNDVTLDWQYTAAPGDTVFSISWFVDGRSQEMVAMASHGAFVPLPVFGSRVQQTTNAGFRLKQVTVGDSGQYSVEINGQNQGGAFTLRRHVRLQVADHLLTTDGRLHVTQSPQALHDDVTDEWHVQLNCGTFTYAGHPPFPVEWLSPSGTRYNSTGYHNNQYQLRLPNPVEEGGYVCQIPPAASPLACLTPGQHAAAQYNVSSVQARLALLEASRDWLRQLNSLLTDINQRLRARQASALAQIVALEAAQHHLQQGLAKDRQCCRQVNASLVSLLSDYHQQDSALRVGQASVTRQLQSLTLQIERAAESAAHCASVADPEVVSFHASMTLRSLRPGLHAPGLVSVQFRRDHSLDDVSHHAQLTYQLQGEHHVVVFRAPHNGTYFFAGSSATNMTGLDVEITDPTAAGHGLALPLQLVVNDQTVAEGLGACEAVVSLAAGDTAFLALSDHVSGAASRQYSTLLTTHHFTAYFDGFLLCTPSD